MNKYLLLLIVPFLSFGQDIIYLNDNSKIESKVIEITSDEVKYKIFSHIEGPLRTLKKIEIKLIVYENGSHESFEINPGLNDKSEINPTLNNTPKSKNRKVGVSLGVNFASLIGEDKNVFLNALDFAFGQNELVSSAGVKIGLSLLQERTSKLNKRYNLGTELYFDQKGFTIKDNNGNYIKDTYFYLTNTFIYYGLLDLQGNSSLSIDLGLFTSFLLNGKTTSEIYGIETSDTYDGAQTGLNWLDNGFILGVSFNNEMENQGYSLSFRLMPSFYSIYDPDFSTLSISWLNLSIGSTFYF